VNHRDQVRPHPALASVTRRDLLKLGAVASVGLLSALAMAGCSSGTPPPATSAPAPKATEAPKPAATAALQPAATAAVAAPVATPAPAAPAPKKGGVLRLAHLSDVTSFDPTALPTTNWPMFFAFYDTLLRYDDKMKASPQLAESWEFGDGGKRLTMKLRQGVTFHSGRDFTADDVIYTLKRFQDKEVAANMRTLALYLKEAKADGKYTVVFTMDQPNAGILDLFDLMFIMDKDREKDIKTKTGGTGPFKLKSWINADKLTCERNPSYWKQGKPYLDGVEVSVVPDASALSISVEAKAIDVADGVLPNDLKRLQGNANLDVIITAYGSLVDDVVMNVSKPPFNNPKVRQAINLSMDRDRFAKNFYAGFSGSACLPYPANSPGYFDDQAKGCEFNLDKAKQLLKDAGLTTVEANFLTSSKSNPAGSMLAQILQADATKIGINLKIEDLEASLYRSRVQAKDFQIAVHSYGRGNKDPLTMVTTAVVWLPDCDQNVANFCSDKFKSLVSQAQVTTDVEKRKPILREINQLLMSENFTVPVASKFIAYVKQKNVQGFAANLDGMPIYDDIWLS
jgi:peptide/nickel transport system substrate-binding protein